MRTVTLQTTRRWSHVVLVAALAGSLGLSLPTIPPSRRAAGALNLHGAACAFRPAPNDEVTIIRSLQGR